MDEADSPSEVKPKLDAMMMDANEKTADALVSEYLKFLWAYQFVGLHDRWDDIQKLEPYFDYDNEAVDPEAITDPEMKALYTELTGSGYRFIATEGTIMPIIDYHLLDPYAPRISTEMEEYGKFMALDSDKIWASDGGLRLDPKELGDRIAVAEQFMTKYPESPRKGEVLEVYRNYLRAFLGGMDNTPVVSGGKYRESFTSAYAYFIEEYPETGTAKVVKEYDEALEASDFAAPYDETDRDSTYDFSRRIDSMVEEAAEPYGSPVAYHVYLMTKENLQMRSGPDLSSRVLITVPKGTIVREFFSWKGWSSIETAGWSGYSLKEYLEPVTMDVEQYRMTTESLNLRKDPDLNSPVLTVVPSGTVLRIESSEDGWGKTTYAGFTGYVSLTYLRRP
jgi:SH3-like domain-containing protein